MSGNVKKLAAMWQQRTSVEQQKNIPTPKKNSQKKVHAQITFNNKQEQVLHFKNTQAQNKPALKTQNCLPQQKVVQQVQKQKQLPKPSFAQLKNIAEKKTQNAINNNQAKKHLQYQMRPNSNQLKQKGQSINQHLKPPSEAIKTELKTVQVKQTKKQSDQEHKINVKNMKNLFQSKLPLGFSGFQSTFQPSKKKKSPEKNILNENDKEKVIRAEFAKSSTPHITYQVQKQEINKLSFQQRRALAQKTFSGMGLHQKKANEQQFKVSKQQNINHKEKQTYQQNNSQKIELKEETYRFSEELSAEEIKKNQQSNDLFNQALKGQNEIQNKIQFQNKSMLNLETRKTRAKKKKTDKDDFDDM